RRAGGPDPDLRPRVVLPGPLRPAEPGPHRHGRDLPRAGGDARAHPVALAGPVRRDVLGRGPRAAVCIRLVAAEARGSTRYWAPAPPRASGSGARCGRTR